VSFEISSALALIPALPLLAAICATRCKIALGARLGATAAVASLASTVWCSVQLYSLPEARRCLLVHLAPALRIGSLDAPLALELDASVAPLALALALIGGLIAIAFAASGEGTERRALVAQSLLLAAAQLTLLSSGFLLTLLAWAATGAAAALLLGRGPPPAQRVAELFLLAGAGLSFWVYGGSWNDAYVPALRPRLVALDTASSDATPIGASKHGELTLSSFGGARLELGTAQLCAIDADGKRGGIGLSSRPCREVAKSPFARLPVPAAIHDLHLYPGPGTHELTLDKVRLQPGKETALLLLGPALGFRELGQQLTVPGLAQQHRMQRAVEASELWGLRALALSVLVFVVAAVAASDRVPRAWADTDLPAPNAAALCGLGTFGGILLLARLDFLLALAPAVASLGVVYGCVTGLRCAALACGEQFGAVTIARAQGGLALAGVCAGAGPPALLYLALASAALAAFALSKPRPRLLGFAAVVLVAAPLPALGMLMRRLYAEGTEYVPGAVLCALFAAIQLLLVFAVRRAYERARKRPVAAVESVLLRWLGGGRPTPALEKWAMRGAGRVGGVLVQIERALYAPARDETER
jgi:hypothetical protein